jgi:hypothetical protein
MMRLTLEFGREGQTPRRFRLRLGTLLIAIVIAALSFALTAKQSEVERMKRMTADEHRQFTDRMT